VRLLVVLLAEADFRFRIKISRAIEEKAGLTRHTKRPALEYLEQQGYIAVEWRGRGKAPIVEPLNLGWRPRRR
jgi:DNA-binding PadR family transcriptional regulator